MDYLNKCFRKATKIVDRIIEDEVVIVPVSPKLPSQDCIYNLDAMGARIWRLIDGKNSGTQIRDYILETTDASRGQAEKDLAEFLRDLQDAGAIEEVK